MNKAKAQMLHAMRRAYERYQLKLSKNDYEEICKKAGDAETLYRDSLRTTVKRLVWRDVELFFVYDSKRHTIATFLKKEFLDMDEIERAKNQLQAYVTNENKFRTLSDWELIKSQVKRI